MRVSSTCFPEWSDNERFFQTPEDSLGFKLESLSKDAVFASGIFPPQYSPSSPFSSRMVRLWRMTLRVKVGKNGVQGLSFVELGRNKPQSQQEDKSCQVSIP